MALGDLRAYRSRWPSWNTVDQLRGLPASEPDETLRQTRRRLAPAYFGFHSSRASSRRSNAHDSGVQRDSAADVTTWVEVALNGPWGTADLAGTRSRTKQCPRSDRLREGRRSIVHFHAYDESTGRQSDDWERYARTIAAIRDAVDVIAYPTVPLGGGAVDRYHHIDELGRRGLIEWASSTRVR